MNNESQLKNALDEGFNIETFIPSASEEQRERHLQFATEDIEKKFREPMAINVIRIGDTSSVITTKKAELVDVADLPKTVMTNQGEKKIEWSQDATLGSVNCDEGNDEIYITDPNFQLPDGYHLKAVFSGALYVDFGRNETSRAQSAKATKPLLDRPFNIQVEVKKLKQCQEEIARSIRELAQSIVSGNNTNELTALMSEKAAELLRRKNEIKARIHSDLEINRNTIANAIHEEFSKFTIISAEALEGHENYGEQTESITNFAQRLLEKHESTHRPEAICIKGINLRVRYKIDDYYYKSIVIEPSQVDEFEPEDFAGLPAWPHNFTFHLDKYGRDFKNFEELSDDYDRFYRRYEKKEVPKNGEQTGLTHNPFASSGRKPSESNSKAKKQTAQKKVQPKPETKHTSEALRNELINQLAQTRLYLEDMLTYPRLVNEKRQRKNEKLKGQARERLTLLGILERNIKTMADADRAKSKTRDAIKRSRNPIRDIAHLHELNPQWTEVYEKIVGAIIPEVETEWGGKLDSKKLEELNPQLFQIAKDPETEDLKAAVEEVIAEHLS